MAMNKNVIVLKNGHEPSEILREDIKLHVGREPGSLADPDELEVLDSSLPKMRSEKIMRRVLKSKELSMEVGALSTLED